MIPGKYIPELYWDEVAKQIERRTGESLVAGDDEPFYRYKKNKFLRLLAAVNFTNKKVLEVGSGPGGNLLEIYKQGPALLFGIDISKEMTRLSEKNIDNKSITVLKTNGTDLPFADQYFDIIITATVLQHITDDLVLTTLIKNMCNVAASEIYIFERIERRKKMSESNTGRTINEYASFFEDNNFYLNNVKFAYLHSSYMACGIVRKILTKRNRKEGEAISSLAGAIQKIILPFTKKLDNIFKRKRDLAMLHFKRTPR
ncbi:MAG: class I SAM-dependent methyltransferase [Bacteroidota bacterium]